MGDFQGSERFLRFSKNCQNFCKFLSFVGEDFLDLSDFRRLLLFSSGFLSFTLKFFRFSIFTTFLGFLKIFRICHKSVREFFGVICPSKFPLYTNETFPTSSIWWEICSSIALLGCRFRSDYSSDLSFSCNSIEKFSRN